MSVVPAACRGAGWGARAPPTGVMLEPSRRRFGVSGPAGLPLPRPRDRLGREMETQRVGWRCLRGVARPERGGGTSALSVFGLRCDNL